MRLISVGPLLASVAGIAWGADFDCVIEPRQTLELRAPLEGLIDRVNVDRGDSVRKGQELIVLDTRVDQVQAAIASHRAQMDGAVRSWDSKKELSSKKAARLDRLHGENYISAQMHDEADTEKRVAEAELQDAIDTRKLSALEEQRQLEIIRLKTIRSPVNGVVVERLFNPGEFAEAGVGRKPLLKIAEIDVLNVEVLLPAAAYGKVKLGSEIQVFPEIPAGSSQRAKVKVIDRVLDAASHTFGVRLELPNADRKIAGGIRCRASFPQIDGSVGAKLRGPSTARTQ